MTTTIHDIVIIGGGLAAAKAAETVRADGFGGALAIVAEELHRPYERPPLSKGYLTGDQSLAEVYVHPPDFYASHDIDLHLGDPATEIDRDLGRVRTRAGRQLRYDRLLLATGARPRRPRLGDGGLDDIVTLRTLDDSDMLMRRLHRAAHVTVVGAGWIGCEVTAAARTFGVDVTMVDPGPTPLARVLGTEVGRVFHDLHVDHGVDLRMGVSATGVQAGDFGQRVTLSDGATIDTDLVVLGVGVTPSVELAGNAGLAVDDGVVVDDTLATADPRILAAGDVARAWHPTLQRHLRVEHWANALNQGTTAGHNLLGAHAAYDRLPYFFSDQYDLGMEYTGHADVWDQVVFRGDPVAREFIAFWLREGRIIAGMNVNIWNVVGDIRALIRAGTAIRSKALADPAVPLAELAAVDSP